MSRQSATYLYCLVRDPKPPDVAGAPAGLPGASRPRRLPLGADGAGHLWLVVADVPLGNYGEAEIAAGLEDLSWVSERALAHEAMVEHFAGSEALVPMKLFTLFADDDRARTYLERELPRLRPALERVALRAEWGVRVRHDAARAAQAAVASAAPAEVPATGRDFLRKKQALRDAARRAPAAAREAADEAFRELAGRAAETRRREPETGTALILDAAFLVDRVDRDCFVTAVGEAASRLAGAGCELTLTGPWPPYSFVGETA